jgi:outer membrane receptor for ferrienterochelin and colicin
VADRRRLGDSVTVEVGLRWDDHSQTDESLLSPRANLAWSLAPRTILRTAWGRFNQSQRPYELQVADGETTFRPVERSVQHVLGVEHHLAGDRAPTLRLELYHREIDNPLPRFENLYEPINTFPEVEPDRVRIEPQRSVSQGAEVFVRGRFGSGFDWWANYSWAEASDRLDGVWTRRHFDQPHTLNLDCDYRVNERWTINLAWRFHTGWPTTELRLEPTEGDEGEVVFVPVLGRPYARRLPDYHRLDLRASRRWSAGSAQLTFFVDVQNAYDRRNVAGFDFEIDEEEGLVVANPEEWAPIIPSAGLRVTF